MFTVPSSPNDSTPSAAAPPQRIWLVGLVLFLLASTVFALTGARSNISMDVWSANLASWRVATTGSPWLDDVSVPQLDNHPAQEVWVMEADNGHRVIGRSPGVVAAALPAYWVSQPARMTALPGGITAAILCGLATMLMFLCLRHRLAKREALLAAALFGFTTPVWTVAANGLWPHTVTIFGIAGMAWAATRDRWWLVGVFGGVAVWGRLHVAVVVAVIGLSVALSRRRPDIAVKVGVVSGAFLALICVWSQWMYGSWNPTASYDTTVFSDYALDNRFSPTNHLGFWFSPDRGIFVWTPLLLLLTPALVRGWRDLPDWSRGLLVGGLAYTLLQATLNRFSGGDTFYGYRLGLEFLACATPAYAMAAHRMGRVARAVFAPVVAVQAVAILAGAVRDGYYVSADDIWRQNAFIKAYEANLAFMSFVLVASLLASVLAARIWADPGVRTKEDELRGGSTSGPDRAASA